MGVADIAIEEVASSFPDRATAQNLFVCLLAVCAFCLLVSPCPASTTELCVDGSVARSGNGTTWESAFKTIQEGIDAASEHDTVIVARGTYIENIHFKGKNIVLLSTEPLDPGVASTTVLDGDGAGPVATFAGTEDETSVLSGFTMRNGNADCGGGVFGGTSKGPRTRATIKNNTIVGNSAKHGGGLYGCDGLVLSNLITGNCANFGGGLAVCGGLVANNTISANSANAEDGRFAGEGGGLYACWGVIRNNVIGKNSAASWGGGLGRCNGSIVNNTIVGNAAGSGGSAFYSCMGETVNCIVWGNVGGNQLHFSTLATYSCIEGWQGEGEGNIRWFPYFADAANGDYHLSSWSLCIDGGDPASPFSEEPEPNGGRVDMGAYGNTPEATSKSPDSDRDGLPDAWEMESFGSLAQGGNDDPDSDFLANKHEYERGLNPLAHRRVWYVKNSAKPPGDGTSWANAFRLIQQGIDAASEWDMVLVAEGSYCESIEFKGKNIRVTGTNLLDSAVIRGTVIDASQLGSVVAFSGMEDETCALSGFTIRSGKSENGAGICGGNWGHHTCASITNCLIAGNRAEYFGGGVAFCDGTIRNNLIMGNWAKYDSGGLVNCNGVIESNTIVGNSAEFSDGGLSGCEGTIVNCIIWGNRPGSQLSGCSVPTFSCIENRAGGGEGNIAFQPYFVNPDSGDFHLKPLSPCIDAGDPSSPFSNEPQPNGGRVDMGVYGNTPEATAKSRDADSDGLPDDWEMLWFGHLGEDGSGDPDGDRIRNSEDYRNSWDPKVAAETLAENLATGTCYQTIQASLSESKDGSEIVVSPGTYVENISLGGKNVVLRSTDPSDPSVVALTIIDGGQSGPVVTFSGTENDGCVLLGFTIRNGRALEGGGIQGGSWDCCTHATIQNNVITGNSGQWGDGGALAFCDGLIQNNMITGNSAQGGGGLYHCSGVIQNNTISENSAQDQYGGGLYYCDGAIQNNVITRNSAGSGGGLHDCDGSIRNNLISSNSARGYWGALAECSGTIQNNTIVGNSGGGLAYCDGTIRNCIIWGNTSGGSGDEVHKSSTPDFSCIHGWTYGGIGNIAYDPLFVDPAGNDYHLQPSSHCMGAGASLYWFVWPERDLDGNCRLARGGVDIGCYEFGSSPDSDGDLLCDVAELAVGTDVNRQDTDSDGLRDGLEMLRKSKPLVPTPPGIIRVPLDVPTIQASLVIAVEGDEIIMAPGLYRENVRFLGLDVALRSSDPDNPDVTASTVIDGRSLGPVVAFTGAESAACLLSGFTIKGGDARCGGGICGARIDERDPYWGEGPHTHATIRGNVISNNTAYEGAGLAFCDGIIENNAIRNNPSEGDSSPHYGGGLFRCDGTIRNNTVGENSATDGGGLHSCNGTIQDNVISGNSAVGEYGCGGGLSECGGLVQSNTIQANRAYQGAGLFDCDGTIRNNNIVGNPAGSSGAGLSHCDGTIEGNAIKENERGGLVWCMGTIQNNLIVGNSGWRAGGLYACSGAIQNNTVVRNSGDGLAYCRGTIRNCIIWGNGALGANQVSDSSQPTYSCIEGWTLGGEGNIQWFPYFVDLANDDYHLRTWSPCIDAGDPSSDFLIEPQPNGGRIDMGAYGNTPEATPASEDIDNDLLPDDWEILVFGELAHEALGDPDGDGLENRREFLFGTDPNSSDTDRDQMPDAWEVANGLCAIKDDAAMDEDEDNLTNVREFVNSTNPNDSDTDDDALSDGSEVDTHNTNPLKADTDSDGMSDNQEVLAGTNPLDAQSVFRVTQIFGMWLGTAIQWTAVPSRTYRCYFSFDLETWSALGGSITAGPSDTSLSTFDWDSTWPTRRFFRVEVLP